MRWYLRRRVGGASWVEPLALLGLSLVLASCGPTATRPPSTEPPREYEAGERVFQELRDIPVIMISENETGEQMLAELEAALLEYGGRGDAALARYSEVEGQPWRMRALNRAVEVFVFSAEVVKETRIMVPRDLRARMAEHPDEAERLEQDFRDTVQTVLAQTSQRLRCRAQNVMDEYLPTHREGADAEDLETARQMRIELTGACGEATGEQTRTRIADEPE